jgi:Ca2+:H+ antiporter
VPVTTNLLLGGLVVAVAARLLAGPAWLVFAGAAAALVPLAGWLTDATEHLARRLGNTLGALMSATMANAIELIITVFALRRGLSELVKASITGSIIGNTLLILGVAAIVGGLRNGPQRFRTRRSAATRR